MVAPFLRDRLCRSISDCRDVSDVLRKGSWTLPGGWAGKPTACSTPSSQSLSVPVFCDLEMRAFFFTALFA